MGTVAQARRFQEKRRLAREQEAKRIAQEKQRQAQISKLSAAEKQKLRQQQAQTIKAEMLRLKVKQREEGRSKASIKELRARRLSLSLQLREAQRTGKILDLARVEAIAKAREQKRAREVKRAPARIAERARQQQAQKISKLDENRAKDILREVAKTGKITRDQSKRFQALGFDERQLTKVAVEKIEQKRLEVKKPKVVVKAKAPKKDLKGILQSKSISEVNKKLPKDIPSKVQSAIREEFKNQSLRKDIQQTVIKKPNVVAQGNATTRFFQRGGNATEYILTNEVAPLVRGFIKYFGALGLRSQFTGKLYTRELNRINKLKTDAVKSGDLKDWDKFKTQKKQFDKLYKEGRKKLEKDAKKLEKVGLKIDANIVATRDPDIRKLATTGLTISAFELGVPAIAGGLTKVFGKKLTNIAIGGLGTAVIGKSYKDALVKNTPQADANALVNTVLIAYAFKGGKTGKPSQSNIKKFDKTLPKVKNKKTTSEKFKQIIDDLFNIKTKKGQKVDTKTINKFNNNVKKKGLPKAKKELAKDLAEFEAERLAKTTKPSKKVKLIKDKDLRFIEENLDKPRKLESLLEDNFGKPKFKKLKNRIEQRTGKKVLVRQTKLKQKVVKGKVKTQVKTKVNIVEKKAFKVQQAKAQKEKKILIKEVPKAEKEILINLDKGTSEPVKSSFSKWDKKGTFKGVQVGRRKSFAKRVKQKARRQFSDAKDIYKVAKNNYKKANKKFNELSAKQRRKSLTSNERKIINRSRVERRKALNTIAKSKKSLIDLEKMLRAVALGIKNLFAQGEISAQDLAKLSDLSKDIANVQDLKKAIDQDLKEAQVQEQKLDQPLKPKPKKKPGKPTKKTRGTKTTVVKKVTKPVKKAPVKIKPKVKRKIKEKVVKKAPIPLFKLNFDSAKLKNKVIKIEATLRERKDPNKPFSKTNVRISKKSFSGTRNRIINRLNKLVDNKLIASWQPKVIGVGKSKKDVLLNKGLAKKFTKKKSKTKGVKKRVEKAKHRLDSKGEKKEIQRLRSIKKKTTKKVVKKAQKVSRRPKLKKKTKVVKKRTVKKKTIAKKRPIKKSKVVKKKVTRKRNLNKKKKR